MCRTFRESCMTMSIPVISTKLFRPHARPDAVQRLRLQQYFLTGLNGRLTLVSAPAGFGKTTLAVDCVSASGRAVAWVSLDESDSDTARFLTYLVAAIQTVVPDVGGAVRTALESPQPPPMETLLTLLLNDLAALEKDLILVLDDYHLVDSTEVDKALEFLLQHLPPQQHLMLLTREDPQLPLARLRASGYMQEIRAAELRFTPEEAADFLNHTMKLSVTTEAVAMLESRTEGWIAGLQMAALSLKGDIDQDAFIRDFAGTHRFVLDYLVEEVLQQCDPQTRVFLLRSSILERMNASLCDSVTGLPDSAERLRVLEQENLFLIPLDAQRGWYRYHHLFGEVLRVRLEMQGDEALSELHMQACHWFENHDLVKDAIRHALAAGNPQYAAQLVELDWPQRRLQEPEQVMLDWMQVLPESVILQRPVLCAYCGLAVLGIDNAKSERFFSAAESALQIGPENRAERGIKVSNEDAFREMPGLLAIGRAYQAGAAGDGEGVMAHAARARELMADKASVWRGSASVLMGLMYWGAGDLSSARNAIAEGGQDMQIVGEISGTISTWYLLANLQTVQGRLDEALKTCDRGRKLAEQSEGPAVQGTADLYVMQAAIRVEQNLLQEAGQLLENARKLGAQAELLESRHLWFVVRARIALCEGDFDSALAFLDEAEENRIPNPAPDPMPLTAWRMRVYLRQDRLEQVTVWADENGLSPEDQPEYLREFEYLTLVRALLLQGRKNRDSSDFRKAKYLLDKLLEISVSGERRLRELEGRILQSLLSQELGESVRAEEALDQALKLAETTGVVRFFADEGKPMQVLLVTAAKSSAVAERLLANFSGDQPPSATTGATALAESLSERELDVLRLLGSELSGPEIASRLFVSLNTVRTHTKNIYSKLGVNNRRSAVRRAAELNIS